MREDIHLANEVLTTAISLRKFTTINVEEDHGIFQMRPQMHIYYVSPFGSAKSQLINDLRKILKMEIYVEDSFTEAGFLGTIDRGRNYNPGTINELGGKVYCVDEWNTVPQSGRSCLLSILENQRFSRKLGYNIDKPQSFEGEYHTINVENGRISGEIQFTAVVLAMLYPTNASDSDEAKCKEKALLSRFTPVFHDFTEVDAFKVLRGKKRFTVNDYANDTFVAQISKDAYETYMKAYEAYYWNHYKGYFYDPDLPSKQQETGYITRTSQDLIRIGVARFLKENQDSERLEINNPDYLTEVIDEFAPAYFQMFKNKDTMTKEELLVELVKKHPNLEQSWYAKKLGITQPRVSQLLKKYQTLEFMTIKDDIDVVQ